VVPQGPGIIGCPHLGRKKGNVGRLGHGTQDRRFSLETITHSDAGEPGSLKGSIVVVPDVTQPSQIAFQRHFDPF
jgi:hypothetical protein